MALFISYSSQDRSTVDALTTALRRGQHQVWFDQELGGGDAWWNKILEQIRSCDVFIVALSSNWLHSKPSQMELRYAQALKRPILPVRIGAVDSMRVNPLATLQIIDYTNPTVDAGIQLVTAVHALRAKPVPLPEPLPEEPPVPFGYITRLGNTLAEKELSPQQQIQLLVELKTGLAEDGDDPSARSDIAQLLRMLRLRHDVTYRTRNEIDQLLESIDSSETPDAKAQPKPAATAGDASTTPTQPSTGPQRVSGTAVSKPSAALVGTGAGSNKRLLIIGGAAVAVIAAIAVVFMLTTQGRAPKKPSTPASGARAAPVAPAPAAPVAPGRLDSILLGAQQIGTIMGVPSTEGIDTATTTALRPDENLKPPTCLGAFDALQSAAYASSGFTGVSGQFFHTADNVFRIYEAAVSFPNPERAKAFVTKSAGEWNACVNQTVTFTTPDKKPHEWTFEGLKVDGPRLTQLRTRTDGGSQCQRVLSAVSDVVLDVSACAMTVADQGSQITDQMAANVK
jgi:serine/threonine kinase PknH